MANPDKEIHLKIEELNKQMDDLAAILNHLADKMTNIEAVTLEVKNNITQDIQDLKDELDIDPDGKT